MKRLTTPILAGSLLLVSTARGFAAQDASIPRKVDSLFAAYDRGDSPGCALAVIQNAAVIYERGYGMASLENGFAITPRTVFDIGSAAKQFAAMSVLLLSQDGKLSLDDDVRKFVPQLPDYGATATLRHLLQHTSGLPDYIDLLKLAGARTEDVVTDEEALHLLALQRRLEFPPGSEHVYSNSGYFLLSQVVRRASGQTLRDFAQARIFGPLGMTQTQYINDHTWVVPGRATGYAPRKGGGYRLDTSNWEQNGDGGLLTTAEDLARWDQNFYDAKIGGRELVQLLQTPGVLSSGEALTYAMGLRVDRYRGLPRVRHGGSWAGFRAELLRFPGERFSVAALCNLSSASAAKLAAQVADLYLEKKMEPPPQTPAAPTPPAADRAPGLTHYAGLYWDQETDDVLTVVEKDQTLSLLRDGDRRSDLVMVSHDRFQTTDGTLHLVFRKAAQARPEMAITAAGAKPQSYQPVDSWSPASSELTAFTGLYSCPELETDYRFIVSTSGLALLSRNGRSEIVKPVFRDTFDSDLAGLIHFRRRGSDISDFEVLSGRTRLVFLRRLSWKP
jgi:CubicO group peptidase (beta-lactamase class C family)